MSGKFFYKTVMQAFTELGLRPDDSEKTTALLWHDAIKDDDYFSALRPWQVVNRLPMVNVICRKAPFIRTIQRIAKFFPEEFNFLPRSYILPHENIPFAQIIRRTKKRHIIKPDGGALGNGIEIIEPRGQYVPWKRLAVAQEYIESALLNGYKFDLRVYALVVSAKPLKVYTYRDGIVRFCSEPASSKSRFSELTNTAVNMRNPGACTAAITKTISEIFPQIQKQGVNTEKLWKEIDRVIALTMIASSSFIAQRAGIVCPNPGYPRCFQVLGFDILLDTNWKPWIMEVNYRPSLEFGTMDEKNLKVAMLKDVMRIAAPVDEVEKIIGARDKPWNFTSWRTYLDRNKGVIERMCAKRRAAMKQSQFVKVFPVKGEEGRSWNVILRAVSGMTTEVSDAYQLPRFVEYIPQQPQQRASQKRPTALLAEANVRKSRGIVRPVTAHVKVM